MSKLTELKEKIAGLEKLSLDINNAQDVATLFNDYWPDIEEVITYIIDMKITKRRTDKKLQEVIDAGQKIYATTSDPEKMKDDVEQFGKLLDEIDQKIDRAISVITFIDKLFREDTKFDNLLENTVLFLTKVSNVIEKLDEKLEG